MVRTKASPIPLLCGLSIGVVLGSRPMSRAKLRVSPAREQLPLSDSHSMVTGRRLTGPKRGSTAASIKSRTSSPLTPRWWRGNSWPRDHSSRARGDPHPFTVVAADLKAVGAPAAVALIDGDASIMAPLDAAGTAIEQGGRGLHHPLKHDPCRLPDSP